MKKSRIFPITNLKLFMTKILLLLILFLNVNSLEESKNHYLYKENDVLLFLTKDGYLNSYKKIGNNTPNQKWKIYLGNNLFFPNKKITKDISISMIDDKLYAIKNNEIIPFNVFVTDLLNKNNYLISDKDDFIIKAKLKYNYLIIDLNEGKLVEELSEEKNSTEKKVTQNNNLIEIKKVGYILEKIDKKTNNIIMNITISDVAILNNKTNHILLDENDIDKIIKDMTLKIDINEIISIYIYSYQDKKINLLYNKDIFDKNYSKEKQSKEQGIKELIQESNSELFYHFNNISEILFHKLFNYNIFNTFLILFTTTILIIIIFKFIPKTKTLNIHNTNIINENFTCENNNPNKIRYEICHNVENLSFESSNNNNKINNEENTKLVKYRPNKALELIKNNFNNKSKTLYNIGMSHCHSSNNLIGRSNLNLFEYENAFNDNNLIEQNNFFEINDKNFINKINGSNIEKIFEPVEQKFKLKNTKIDPINNQVYVKIEENTKQNITLKMPLKNFNEYKYFLRNNNKLISQEESLNLIKSNTNLIKPEEPELISISKNSSAKKGIWDSSIDESLEEEIDTSNNNLNNIKIEEPKTIRSLKFNDNNIITKDYKLENKDSIISEELNETKVIKKVKSRLDQDFKNLEKIGEGGFGIVLKGVHRLDKGVNAIKIIKLSNVSDKENIINEAITMTRISSKHIVQYKTCWIDNIIGTAKKFFEDEEDSGEDQENSKSDINMIKSKSSNMIIKEEKNSLSDSDSSSDDEDDYSIKKIRRNISKDLLKVKNKDNNSQENKKIKNKNALTKYYNDYRDDSHMIKESNISKKYNSNNNTFLSNYSTNSYNGKYFFILMEYCDGLTLEKYIEQHANKGIERKIIYSFTHQLLKSLSKIHLSGIIHRDIKPSNIFIKNDQIKIGDFGLATHCNNCKFLKSKKIEGTPLYLSPEQTSFKTYNEKVDIYACGITLYEMCACFYTKMERYESIMNLKNNQVLEERVCKDYPEETMLIKLMTKKDFNERPSANDILKLELFIDLGKKLGL